MTDFTRAKLEGALFTGAALRGAVFADATTDVRFKDSKSVAQNNILSLLAAPVRVGESVVGAIYLDMRSDRRSFSEADRRLVEAISVLAGKAIQQSDLIDNLRRENFSLKDSVSRYTFGGIIAKRGT